MTVTYDEILYEIDGPVATITMNRPDQLNALTDLTQAEIRYVLDQSERNPDVVGTVLTGAGRGFCAGVESAIEVVNLALKKYGAPIDQKSWL